MKQKILENKIINENQKKKAIEYINSILDSKSEKIALFHKQIEFDFIYNLERLTQINNTKLKEKLKCHIMKIIDDKYPKELFNNGSICSASDYILKGTHKDPI